MKILVVRFRKEGFYSQRFAFGGEEGPPACRQGLHSRSLSRIIERPPAGTAPLRGLFSCGTSRSATSSEPVRAPSQSLDIAPARI